MELLKASVARKTGIFMTHVSGGVWVVVGVGDKHKTQGTGSDVEHAPELTVTPYVIG